MTWIQTHSGRKFSLIDPQPEDVSIDDVVASLSELVRFNGHSRGHYRYTVLQHSVRVAEICDPQFRFDGLLHDAAESYYGDITRPQKIVLNSLSCGRVSEWMERIDAVVALALGFNYPLPPEVKHADAVMLATEARDLMAPPPETWALLPEPLSERIELWSPQETHCRFIDAYNELRPR